MLREGVKFAIERSQYIFVPLCEVSLKFCLQSVRDSWEYAYLNPTAH